MNEDFLTMQQKPIQINKTMDNEFADFEEMDFANMHEEKKQEPITRRKVNKPAPFKKLSKVKKVIKSFSSIKKGNSLYNKVEAANLEQKIAILDMCKMEREIPHATKEFKKVMDKLESYAKSKNYDSEQKTLAEAMKSIQDYIDKNGVTTNDNEYELLERVKAYSYFFVTKTNGTLSGYEHNKEKTVANPDAGSMNVWKDVSNHKLFPHEPSVMDVKQRRTEDCYMLSTLSGIALTSPELIKQAMKDNGDGTVTVRFYDNLDKPVQYKDLTIEQIYKQQFANELEADIMALTKLFSDMLQDQKFIDEYIKDRAKNGTKTDDEDAAENVDETTQTVEFSKELLDGFDIDDDFSASEQTVEKKQEDSAIVIQKEYDYRRAADSISGSMYSNNTNWYSEVLRKCLSEEGKQKIVLNKIVEKIKTKGFTAEVQKEALGEFIDSIYKDASLANSFKELKADSLKMENKEVFITVSKEISTIGGIVEKNAADSLWVQMIEKAYAARYGHIDGAEKNLTGYKGISLNNSSMFIKRFLNRNYEDRSIFKSNRNDIDIMGDIKFEQAELDDYIRAARELHKEKGVNIENVMKIIMSQDKYKELTDEQQQQLIRALGNERGLMHEEFSEKYTEKAEAEFEKINTMLMNKEFVTVGVNKDRMSKERINALNSSGIRVGHAYAVIGCVTEGNLKYVTLRDPYGLFRREYSRQEHEGGEVSYKKENASKISLEGSETMGIFNMELNDFFSTFDTYSGILKG